MTIESYLDDLEDKQDLYRLNWVLPFGSAYADAHAAYQSTLNAQRQKDKLKAQLVMLVASIGIGGGMTAVFGTAVVRSVVVNQAVSAICNRNMNRLFNAVAAVEASPAASFMAQTAWDGLARIVSAETQRQVEGLVGSSPVANSIANPLSFQNDLETYVLRAKTAAFAIGRDIRDATSLSQDQKTSLANQLRSAPFFANAPRSSTVSDPQKTRKEIELMFYMLLVMDSDYLLDTSHTRRGDNELISRRRVGGIGASPTAANYPSGGIRHHGGGDFTHRSVEYDRPGGSFDFFNEIMPRANELHRQLFGSNFERGDYGRDEVVRAEQVVQRIQSRHLQALPVRGS